MTARSRRTVLLCGALLAIAAIAGPAAAAEETELVLEPADQAVETGDVAAYDVVVTDAQGGVGSFDLAVTVEDPAVAEVANVSYADDPAFTNRPSDGQTAQLAATGMDTPNGGSVRVATVEVAATDAGSTALSLSVSDVADESGRSYDVTGTGGATLSVSAPDDDDDRDDSDDEGDEDESDEGDDGDEQDSDGQDGDEPPNDGDDGSTPSDGDDGSGEAGGNDGGAPAPDAPADDGDEGASTAVVAVLVVALLGLGVGVGAHFYRR